MPIPRAMKHPGQPAPEPIFMKGKYAVRKDGAVLVNTPTLNKRTDFEFTDELPDWHVAAIKAARARAESNIVTKEEFIARTEQRIALQEQRTKESIENARKAAEEQASTPEEQEVSAKFVIANAKSVTELADFVQKHFEVKLDRRKSLNTLQHEAAALIKAD